MWSKKYKKWTKVEICFWFNDPPPPRHCQHHQHHHGVGDNLHLDLSSLHIWPSPSSTPLWLSLLFPLFLIVTGDTLLLRVNTVNSWSGAPGLIMSHTKKFLKTSCFELAKLAKIAPET